MQKKSSKNRCHFENIHLICENVLRTCSYSRKTKKQHFFFTYSYVHMYLHTHILVYMREGNFIIAPSSQHHIYDNIRSCWEDDDDDDDFRK